MFVLNSFNVSLEFNLWKFVIRATIKKWYNLSLWIYFAGEYLIGSQLWNLYLEQMSKCLFEFHKLSLIFFNQNRDERTLKFPLHCRLSDWKCLHVWLCICPQRPTTDGVLRDGHLRLSGLQMRAHAMFSAQGLLADSDTLEYAWLIDMQAGGLTGRVTIPQVGVIRIVAG